VVTSEPLTNEDHSLSVCANLGQSLHIIQIWLLTSL